MWWRSQNWCDKTTSTKWGKKLTRSSIALYCLPPSQSSDLWYRKSDKNPIPTHCKYIIGPSNKSTYSHMPLSNIAWYFYVYLNRCKQKMDCQSSHSAITFYQFPAKSKLKVVQKPQSWPWREWHLIRNQRLQWTWRRPCLRRPCQRRLLVVVKKPSWDVLV